MSSRPDTDFTLGVPEQVWTQLQAVREPIALSATLPPLVYSDAGVYQLEREAVFRNMWVGVGRADRWPGSGDYADIEVAEIPVFIVRDNGGELRAFANSCRHRGAKLLSKSGNCSVIRCPFHRWTYALDGRLLNAPAMDQTEGFDSAEYGLVPIHITERHGFAFVSLAKQPPDIDAWLGNFAEIHQPWSLSSVKSTRRREFEVNCNWKVFLEVFNEYYHLPYVHPGTLGNLYNTPQVLDDATGNYVTQFGTTEGTGALLAADQSRAMPVIPGISESAARGTRYSWIFPNMTFASGAESIWIYDAIPLSPDRTRVGMTVCFPEESTSLMDFETRVQDYYHRMDIALEEDIPAIENQHQGLRSPLAKQGRFCYLEPAVGAFACWYSRTLLENRIQA